MKCIIKVSAPTIIYFYLNIIVYNLITQYNNKTFQQINKTDSYFLGKFEKNWKFFTQHLFIDLDA